MNSQERLNTALAHKQPDRVPIDLGGSANTGITIKAYDNLKEYLGIKTPTEILDKSLQLAKVEPEILHKFNIDTRGIFPNAVPGSTTKYEDGSFEDEWGIIRTMPEDGLYYDLIKSPFADGITARKLDNFSWPDGKSQVRVEGLKEEIEGLSQKHLGVVANLRGGFIGQSQLMRGFEGWFMDIALNPQGVCDLMDRILKYQLDFFDSMIDGVEDEVDVIVYGDDLGTQSGPMISPPRFRKYLKPKLAQLFNHISGKTSAKIHLHSCGSVYKLIPDLIEIGVEVLNPIQVNAADMDPVRLKQEFGDSLSFWGAIDTHDVLPNGSTEDVKKEVKKRIDQLAPGGGYVLNSVHNIQPDVPPENIVAMFEAARNCGEY